MYAYYDTQSDTDPTAYKIRPMIQNSAAIGVHPFETGATPAADGSSGKAGVSAGLKSIHIPPGYDNMFLNLASDLFSQPMGLLLVLKDNAKNNISSLYLEQCHIPQHMIAVDSNGLIMQESVAVQYERIVPIKNTQLDVVDGVLNDATGGYTTARNV
jgi:hypothetical protein